eukprot:GHVO01018280.1.p1 GENE.GHVO01018280.1~~GHVO01018280.1.p1  ORF type:complete len:197 (+),score=30.22 GHVO01018280.1:449-1039(+)
MWAMLQQSPFRPNPYKPPRKESKANNGKTTKKSPSPTKKDPTTQPPFEEHTLYLMYKDQMEDLALSGRQKPENTLTLKEAEEILENLINSHRFKGTATQYKEGIESQLSKIQGAIRKPKVPATSSALIYHQFLKLKEKINILAHGGRIEVDGVTWEQALEKLDKLIKSAAFKELKPKEQQEMLGITKENTIGNARE